MLMQNGISEGNKRVVTMYTELPRRQRQNALFTSDSYAAEIEHRIKEGKPISLETVKKYNELLGNNINN